MLAPTVQRTTEACPFFPLTCLIAPAPIGMPCGCQIGLRTVRLQRWRVDQAQIVEIVSARRFITLRDGCVLSISMPGKFLLPLALRRQP